MNDAVIPHSASYRDPSGFIFTCNGTLYRQVNLSYKEQFDHFVSCGGYEQLVKNNLLLPHEVIRENLTGIDNWYLTLKPEPVEFISYPYEWSFSMLKDAALLTLQIMKKIIPLGMILKDATPANIQWHKGNLIFIDTLSFEKFEEKPWIAYRQFCESFLSPLLLMHYVKIPLHRLLIAYPEGIPLNITRALLPGKSKFSLPAYLHIHFHAKISNNKAGSKQQPVKFSKQKLLHLIADLENFIKKLKLPKTESAWSSYYTEAEERGSYLREKKNILESWINGTENVTQAIDLGSNNGEFSKLSGLKGIRTIATDFDPNCIEELYSDLKRNNLKNIQPLIIDLSDPSPSSGVNNLERTSFLERANPDLVLALALIHHLAIAKNIPLPKIAFMFSLLLKKKNSKLIIEFIPREDEKVQFLLQNRKDIFENYTETGFLQSFEKYFSISLKQTIPDTKRVLYKMEKK